MSNKQIGVRGEIGLERRDDRGQDARKSVRRAGFARYCCHPPGASAVHFTGTAIGPYRQHLWHRPERQPVGGGPKRKRAARKLPFPFGVWRDPEDFWGC